jgi:hypothetical protein
MLDNGKGNIVVHIDFGTGKELISDALAECE